MKTNWNSVCRILQGFGLFFIGIGIFVVIYDTIYSLQDGEAGLIFVGPGLVLVAIAGILKRKE